MRCQGTEILVGSHLLTGFSKIGKEFPLQRHYLDSDPLKSSRITQVQSICRIRFRDFSRCLAADHFCRTQSMLFKELVEEWIRSESWSLQLTNFQITGLHQRMALNLLGSGGSHGFAGATGHVRRWTCAAGATEKDWTDWNVNLFQTFQASR